MKDWYRVASQYILENILNIEWEYNYLKKSAISWKRKKNLKEISHIFRSTFFEPLQWPNTLTIITSEHWDKWNTTDLKT